MTVLKFDYLLQKLPCAKATGFGLVLLLLSLASLPVFAADVLPIDQDCMITLLNTVRGTTWN